MKYEVTRNVVIEGKDHHAGDVVELEKSVAVGLLASGQVVEHSKESKSSDRSVGLDSSDSKTVKTRSKKK
tara:strand:+ start:1349 stop:1558 length:210 start_codon:yes stop_codon:yes gene_type:complete